MHKLRNTNNFSRPQLAIFIIAFALIGYLIFRSFALNPNLPGDLNNDNTVNITDMSILLSNYNTSSSTADINSDGTVNVLDLSILLSNYGQSYTPGVSLGSKLPARLPQSTGSTYYVDGTNGNDANNGSSAAPWKTINHALNAVPLTGSIIRVKPGTYYSSGGSYVIQFTRAGNINNPVTLMADQPGTVLIASSNLSAPTIGAWILRASGLRIQGLNFKILNDQSVNNGYEEVLIENSDWVELANCTFYETAGQAVVTRGGAIGSNSTADNIWIINNTFRPSSSNPLAQVTGLGYPPDVYFGSKGSHWIYAGQWGQDGSSVGWNQTNGGTKLVVANNVFVGAAAGRDIEFGPEQRDSFIVNNTFYGNQSLQTIGIGAGPGSDASAVYAGQGLALYADTGTTAYETGNNIVTNNIFDNLYGHAVSGSGSAEAGNIVQRNLAYQLTNGGGYDGPTNVDYYPTSNTLFTIGTGNLPAADPMFVGAGSFNYQLQTASPAIGKSDPAYTYPSDITGKIRPANPDLGPYQH